MAQIVHKCAIWDAVVFHCQKGIVIRGLRIPVRTTFMKLLSFLEVYSQNQNPLSLSGKEHLRHFTNPPITNTKDFKHEKFFIINI